MAVPAPPPPAARLNAALGRSEPLTGLLQRVRESQARLQAVSHLLPVGLQGLVRSGPLDDAAWVLLVGNASAAAKMRQLLPELQAALAARGWPGPPIRVKVLPRA